MYLFTTEMERACICESSFVCWCDVDKACLQLQVDMGNSDDGMSQVLRDSRLILLVRIRGFSLPVGAS